MPAIELARLRMQSALLADSFTRPEAFVKGFRALLEYYANRSHRPGQSGKPAPLLHSYNVPPPVQKQILQELAPLITTNPEAALRLSGQLWQEENLECRLLAAQILARLPATQGMPALKQVEDWLSREQEDRLINVLLQQSLAKVRQAMPEQYLAKIRSWLAAEDINRRETGLRALQPLVEEGFDNLPVIFQILTPYSREVSSHLRPFLLNVLRLLVERSPQETAFFLRHSLEMPGSPDTPWLIRQLMPLFPEELRESLRRAVRKKEWES